MPINVSRKIILFAPFVVVIAFMMMKSAPTVSAKSFMQDPEYGMVFEIPASDVLFLSLPMRLSIVRGPFGRVSVSAAEVKRANKILSVLPSCVREAEQQLLRYAGPDMVQSHSDIQNPHVWLSDEVEHPDDWAIVVEMKDNDGYGWHIEFRDAKFMKIWSGS